MNPEAIEILPAVYEETLPILKTQDGREIKYIRRDEVHRILSFVEGRDKLFGGPCGTSENTIKSESYLIW